MKVIFLDVDGVLNCYPNDHVTHAEKKAMLHNDLVNRFKTVLRLTGAKIVLSSTWRLSKHGRNTLKSKGLNFISCTPRMPLMGGAEMMERGKEIQAWLTDHPEVEKYCIIDDDSDMLPHQKHFKTSFTTGGLTVEIANEVIAYLNRN